VPAETLLALTAFGIAAAFTPGPNNIMLAASGMNFGFRRTAPHMAGIVLGFATVILGVGFGLGTLFFAYPSAQTALKFAGTLYLLWLAWRIANASPADPAARPRPITFVEAALFQWVNPKGLVAVFSAISIFIRPERAASDVFVVALVFFAVSIGAVVSWTAFGTALRSLLGDTRKVRIFNIAMALLLVASIAPMVLPWGANGASIR
jgi:threonine/homoserine/homoserine lactone efflux protein